MGAIGPYPLIPPDLNLVESLVEPLIDSLRADLHPQMGIRPYRVYVVTETWSGRVQGQGSVTTSEVELTPQPLVEPWRQMNLELDRCGIDEAGFVSLKEVSLTYTYETLTGQAVVNNAAQSTPKNQRVMYRIDDAQPAISNQPGRYFTLARPPFRDTEHNLGWEIRLRSIAS